jgi:hypothetical protein
MRAASSPGRPPPLTRLSHNHCDGEPPAPGTRLVLSASRSRVVGVVGAGVPGTKDHLADPGHGGYASGISRAGCCAPPMGPRYNITPWRGPPRRAPPPRQLGPRRAAARFCRHERLHRLCDPWTGPSRTSSPQPVRRRTFLRAVKTETWIQRPAPWAGSPREGGRNRKLGADPAVTSVTAVPARLSTCCAAGPVLFQFIAVAEATLPVAVADVLRDQRGAPPPGGPAGRIA